MEKYCSLIDQIPAMHFNEIAGFQPNTFLKLKVMRQKFKARTQLLQKHLDKNESKLKAEQEALEQEERSKYVTLFKDLLGWLDFLEETVSLLD